MVAINSAAHFYAFHWTKLPITDLAESIKVARDASEPN
jgi:hypothetical protein